MTKEKKNNRQLIVILKSDGYFEIDWREIMGVNSEKELLIKEDLYKRFQINPFKELLILGLSEKRMTISQPLCYLRTIALLFVRKLYKKPDIEMIRDRISVYLEDREIIMLLGEAPYLIGEEYLNKEWIKAFWKNINKAYAEMIRLHVGSVESFFEKYNPHMNLIGRIFFHLVEDKKRRDAFVFLATYSAYVSKNGKVKYLPLKNALLEYKDDYQRLDDLFSSINIIRKKSEFISKLFDSEDIFKAVTLNIDEVYT
ncbi:MAG: hypothetical protein J7L15_04645, partial [Clostridiales bacterium]|nr:hypothetical protein [Clostridiales bacterium]